MPPRAEDSHESPNFGRLDDALDGVKAAVSADRILPLAAGRLGDAIFAALEDALESTRASRSEVRARFFYVPPGALLPDSKMPR